MNKKKTTIPPQRQPLIETFFERNSQINLSAIRTPEDIYTKHILDSLELNNIINLNNDKLPNLSVKGEDLDNVEWRGFSTDNPITLLDIWTWWWFPLLPLAITHPDISCIWLDARKKKCFAIDEMVKVLWLKNVKTLRARAEETTLQVDILTSRAMTYADQLFHRALPLVKPWWLLIFYKLFTQEEDNTILSLIRQHNLTLKKMHHYTLPGDGVERVIYIMEKSNNKKRQE